MLEEQYIKEVLYKRFLEQVGEAEMNNARSEDYISVFAPASHHRFSNYVDGLNAVVGGDSELTFDDVSRFATKELEKHG